MVTTALVVTLTYWLVNTLDSFLGNQTVTRPIVMATAVGIALGDLKTGVLMGAALESIYMGIQGIGGALPSDFRTSSVIATAFVILSSADIETGLALAMPIGALMATANTLRKTFADLLQPYFNKLAEQGKAKEYVWATLIGTATLQYGVQVIIIFMSIAFGVEAIEAAMNALPVWAINGFNVSGGVLVAVGIGMLSTSIWSKESGIFVVFGFILAKYLGLSPLISAALAMVIAVTIYFREVHMNELEAKIENGGNELL